MSAAETIAAAIEKLVGLKTESTPGEWWSGVSLGTVFAGPGLSDDVAVAYDIRLPADGNLIVTLHRTIDAQLAALRAGIDEISPGDDTTEIVTEIALDLARAILKAVSS